MIDDCNDENYANGGNGECNLYDSTIVSIKCINEDHFIELYITSEVQVNY